MVSAADCVEMSRVREETFSLISVSSYQDDFVDFKRHGGCREIVIMLKFIRHEII